MSKARSPREVCSTTIGTSGLIEPASLATPTGAQPTEPAACPLRAGRPDLPAARLVLLLVGRPQLLARRRLLHRDRLCALDEQVDRLAHGDVLAQRLVRTLGACALERALDLLVRG